MRTRYVLGASDVADVRHDSVPQSGHSGGGLSHTKGDDGQPHYHHNFDGYDILNDNDADYDDSAFLVENYLAPKTSVFFWRKNTFLSMSRCFFLN